MTSFRRRIIILLEYINSIFRLIITTAHKVIGLNISMKKTVLVHEGQALEDLVHDVSYLGLGEVPLARLHDLR